MSTNVLPEIWTSTHEMNQINIDQASILALVPGIGPTLMLSIVKYNDNNNLKG